MLSSGAAGAFPPARIDALLAALADFSTIGLAVSGGPDSLALLLLFARWSPARRKPDAIVYTVDHGLRPDAAAEAAMVAEQAERLGLRCRVLRWGGEKPLTGVQDAARQARYRLIAAAMAEDGAEALVVAHHREDQAETVLMRLARGSGAHGLAAMRPRATVGNVTVLRPLLALGRAELAALVASAGLVAADDPSNTNPDYERVRWREAMPALAALGLGAESLATTAARLARIDAFAAGATEMFLQRQLAGDDFGVFALPRAALNAADDEIAVRAMMAVLTAAGGKQAERLAAVEGVVERLRSGEVFAATLMGARIVADADRVTVFREAGRMAWEATALDAGEAVAFDRRFEVCALRAGLTLQTGGGLTRREAERWLGDALALPMAAIAAAPMVTDADGRIVALGARSVDPDVTVRPRDWRER